MSKRRRMPNYDAMQFGETDPRDGGVYITHRRSDWRIIAGPTLLMLAAIALAWGLS